MVFSSTVFLFCFLPITIVGYYLVPNKTYRNFWLLLMSFIFFGWSQPRYLWIIVASIVLNYCSAMLIYFADKNKTARRAALALSVVCNLGLLFYFKYFDFAIDSVNGLLHTEIPLKNIVLPIGISFFTFQGMSYVIDVYRKDVDVQKDPLKVALYVVLFPQLIAGPIVRYRDIELEISNRRQDIEIFSEGITRFIIGLGKKAIIANTMAEVADGIWSAGVGNNTVAIAWIGSIAYSLQIFYDFSGYSDMAIGIGRMFGFHFCKNFDRPYISKSITEFWRRWHISLSSWFRDYVYIPLGGNRKHLYRNLIIVFLLTGLWHGASWHFVVWGIWNGFFIVVERLLRGKNKKKDEPESLLKSVLGHVYALFVVNLGWVLFRADTIVDAINYIGTMFGIGLSATPGFQAGWYINRWVILVAVLALLDIAGLLSLIKEKLIASVPVAAGNIMKIAVVYGILILSIMRVMSGTYNPFIYFQF